MSSHLYSTIFLYSVIVLTFVSLSSVGSDYDRIKKKQNNTVLALLICLFFAVWLGKRPPTYEFADTGNYAHIYYLMQSGEFVLKNDGEKLWYDFMYACSQIIDVSEFFTIVALGYFGFTLWACWRLTPNNVLVSCLFCMGAFSFYSYATNGIRNGLACSLILLFLSYLKGNKKEKIIAFAIAFIAINFHRTTMLPVLMAFLSIYFIKSFKWAYTFWLLSIFISLIAGGAITTIFAGLGFEDRASYLTSLDNDRFTHTGFRWDFLIYSMMPIILGFYVIIKRGIQDKTYLLLLNTYTLANAFWVMVIRANYSNRFAYLSWFMYPLVLAYPLLRLDIWGEQQGKRLKQIMLAQVGFTWFMETFIWK